MRTVVVEDSRIARHGLITMLRAHPDIELVGDAEHPDSAREVIAKTRPELLFLDVHMPGESGFELLESLDYTPKIIFTTAFSEYAIRSFEFNTVDYLLKPISDERLALAISKLTLSADESVEAGHCDPPLYMDSHIFIKDSECCHLVIVEKIHYIESCKNYVRVYFDEHKAFVKKSLNQVEQRLPSVAFFRANRQYIVNFHAISNVEPAVGDGYVLTMLDGKQIDVSRRNASRLKETLSL